MSVGVVVYLWNLATHFINQTLGLGGTDMDFAIRTIVLLVYGIVVIGGFVNYFPRKIGFKILELAIDDTEFLTKYRHSLSFMFDWTTIASSLLAAAFVILSVFSFGLFKYSLYSFGVVVPFVMAAIIGFTYFENVARVNKFEAHERCLGFCTLLIPIVPIIILVTDRYLVSLTATWFGLAVLLSECVLMSAVVYIFIHDLKTFQVTKIP